MLYSALLFCTPSAGGALGSGRLVEDTEMGAGIREIEMGAGIRGIQQQNNKKNNNNKTKKYSNAIYSYLALGPADAIGLPRMFVRPLASTPKLFGMQISVPRLPLGAGRVLQLKCTASSSER